MLQMSALGRLLHLAGPIGRPYAGCRNQRAGLPTSTGASSVLVAAVRTIRSAALKPKVKSLPQQQRWVYLPKAIALKMGGPRQGRRKTRPTSKVDVHSRVRRIPSFSFLTAQLPSSTQDHLTWSLIGGSMARAVQDRICIERGTHHANTNVFARRS